MAKNSEIEVVNDNVFAGIEAAECFKEYLIDLSIDNDKGMVLIASGVIEDILKQLILKRLHITQEKDDPLFRGDNAPLNTFASRIELCMRLGIIGNKTKRDLNIFKKIRNEFAHVPHVLSLDEPSSSNRLREILSKENEVWKAMSEIIGSDIETWDSRKQFRIYFAILMMQLKRLMLLVETIDKVKIP